MITLVIQKGVETKGYNHPQGMGFGFLSFNEKCLVLYVYFSTSFPFCLPFPSPPPPSFTFPPSDCGQKVVLLVISVVYKTVFEIKFMGTDDGRPNLSKLICKLSLMKDSVSH